MLLSFPLLVLWSLVIACEPLALSAAEAPEAKAASGTAALADAAERGEREAIKALVSQGAAVDAPQADGMTALHWAVYRDDLGMVRQLIAAGADVTLANVYDVAPLSTACTVGNAEIVRLLLRHGADPRTTRACGETALMTAARTGRVEPVRELLEQGADVHATERGGQTALMWAAAEGHASVVRVLLDAGADDRAPLKSGFTPLMFAVREGRGEVVQMLLEAGADVNEAIVPQKPAAKGPRRGTSPLILALENGHFALAALLLKAGADPNDARTGYTPLHTLSWVRKPNRGDGDDGDPPPLGSGPLSSLQLVRALVAHGAEVNARLEGGRSGRGRLNETGATPLMMAADTADVPLMQLLVELGADPLLPNADGCTPLMAAAGIGTLAPGEEAGTEAEALAAVRLLLQWGAELNTADKNGETAMHGAAYASWPEMVKLLDESGADIGIWNRQNRYGWTPLRIAQGYRPGNFKPAAETMLAIEQVMRGAGVDPPPAPPRDGVSSVKRP